MAGHVDLNHAGPEELTAIPGIDARRADDIVAYRSQHGAFQSWEDVERVPGIGATVTERLRERATLGEEVGAAADEIEPSPAEVGGAEADEEEVDETAEIIEDEVASLSAIANLDHEAALVYELVADSVEDDQLSDMLRRFAQDHRRHVDSLDRLAREQGFEERRQSTAGVLLGLASTIGALDDDAAVEALIANEQLTNATYRTALWVLSLPAADAIMKKNAADEQRHLEWLLEYQERQESKQAEH